MEGISTLALPSRALACFRCIACRGFLFSKGSWFGAARCDERVPGPFRLPPDAPARPSVFHSILAHVNRVHHVRPRCMEVGSKEEPLARIAFILDPTSMQREIG